MSPGAIATPNLRAARVLVLLAVGCELVFLALCPWFPPAAIVLLVWCAILLAIARLTVARPGPARWVLVLLAVYSCWSTWRFLNSSGDTLVFFPHYSLQRLIAGCEAALLIGAAGLALGPSLRDNRLRIGLGWVRLPSGQALVATGCLAWSSALGILYWSVLPVLEKPSYAGPALIPVLLPATLGLRLLFARRVGVLDAVAATLASGLACVICLSVAVVPWGYVPLAFILAMTARGRVGLGLLGFGTVTLVSGTFLVWARLSRPTSGASGRA